MKSHLSRRRCPAPLVCTVLTVATFIGGPLGAQSIPPRSGGEEVVRLSEFVVGSESDRGYVATRASSATKTNVPIIELPHSVQVLNREFIEDTAAASMYDLVRFTSNASGGDPRGDDALQIRGFPISRYRNGMPFPTGNAFTFEEMAGIERVEVVRGASAVLYGTAPPGGLINIVDKRPLPTRQTELKLQVGSHQFYKGIIDTTGPLARWGETEIDYRAIVAYEDSESYRDFAYRRRSYFNGSLAFRFAGDTTLIQRLEFQKDDLLENYGKPWIWFPPGSTTAEQGVLLNLPDRFHRGDSRDYKDVERFNWETTVEHRFSDNWSLRGTAVYTDVYAKRLEIFISAQSPNINVWPRFYQLIPDDQQQWVAEVNLLGNFEAGPTRHQLLFGYNYFDNNRASANYRFNVVGPPFDVFNPQYGVYSVGAEVLNVRRESENYTDAQGFFVQDQMRFWNDRLSLVLGVRRDKLDQVVVNLVNGVRTTQSDRKTSPRYALLWRIAPEWSTYVSYNESFTPSPGTVSVQGVPFPSPTAEQLEWGLKFDGLEGRLSGSISIFENTRFNLTTVDVLNPGFFVATGEVRSRGGEVEFGYSILPNWQVIAAAGKQNAKITRDNNPARVGRIFENTPGYSGALWTKYDFTSGPLAGLYLGGGVVHERDRVGYEGNIRFPIPDYTVCNVLVGYRLGNHRVALNVENLFDTSVPLRASGARFMQMGERRGFKLSYSYTFR
jgi:iron complex outermembrane receptor protein